MKPSPIIHPSSKLRPQTLAHLDEKTELQYSTSNGIIDINPLLQIIIQWYPALRIYVSNPSYWNGKAQAGVQESIG